jgi:hypothetical protein
VSRFLPEVGRVCKMLGQSPAQPSWPDYVPAIHVFPGVGAVKTWMPGTRPGMTINSMFVIPGAILREPPCGIATRYPSVTACPVVPRFEISISIDTVAWRPASLIGIFSVRKPVVISAQVSESPD